MWRRFKNADLAKLGKFLDARIGDVGVLQAEFAELGEAGQGRDARIVDFRAVKVELDHVLQGRQQQQVGVGRCPRIEIDGDDRLVGAILDFPAELS